uniref:Uncharacterized protein n=1 Tax=Sus scrofa TaxID=9823 RepID=A0A4X1SS67_PIG
MWIGWSRVKGFLHHSGFAEIPLFLKETTLDQWKWLNHRIILLFVCGHIQVEISTCILISRRKIFSI